MEYQNNVENADDVEEKITTENFMWSIAIMVEIDDIEEFVTVDNVDVVSSIQTKDGTADVVDVVEKFWT